LQADAKRLSALDTPAKRKKSEDSDTDDDREATSHGGEIKKPPKKKKKKARRANTGETGQPASTKNLEPVPKKRKHGRPPKSAEEKAARHAASASGSPPFNASVFISVEQPPQLVHGKTHRSDKHVAQDPLVAGPFTLLRMMKWAEFLDEVAECVRVDKENLQVNGLSWGFQKQKAQLPLTSEQAFKTLREQVKMKNGAATVIFVYHPICKRPQGQDPRGQEPQDNVNDRAVVVENESHWEKKVRYQINCRNY
jgi:hypothetical protein